MSKKIILIALINLFVSGSLSLAVEKSTIRSEVLKHLNHNITQKTHPILYSTIEDLARKANTSMPTYITLYRTDYSFVDNTTGIIRRKNYAMAASVDIVGDLYICYETLIDLSDEEIIGILALAMSERAFKKHLKMFVVGALTSALTVGEIFALNKFDAKKFGEFWDHYVGVTKKDPEAHIAMTGLLAAPTLATIFVYSNYIQKQIDLLAAQITTPETIIKAITALEKITETYMKKSLFRRFTRFTKLDTVYENLFYPVRGYTNEERIAYLKKATAG